MPRVAAEGGDGLCAGLGQNCVSNLHGSLRIVDISGVEPAAQVDGCLAGAQVLAGEFQRGDQLFVQLALFPTDFPESRCPMIGWRRVRVLRAEGQRSDHSVEQIALVGVVAVDAQATPTQG